MQSEIDALLNELVRLAMQWRGMNISGNTQKRNEVTNQYHHTMRNLFALGWEGVLDIDSELPDQFMPQEYFNFWNTKNAR